MDHPSPDKTAAQVETPLVSSTGYNRYQLILLHTLVTIVLCYQLLFSKDPLLHSTVLDLVALALIGTIIGLSVLPRSLWATRWLVWALVLFDTGITTVAIYLSGHASSNFYVAYFLIMLIAAFAPTLSQMLGLSVILCLSYGVMLYLETGELGVLGESHWLQIPILLILAIFYGSTNESARKLSRDKTLLVEQISERKRAEKALRESEERYRRLVEVSPYAIFITRRHRIVFMNQACYRLLKATSPDQIIGRSPFDFFDPEDDPAVNDTFRRALGEGRHLPLIERRILCLDGTVITAELAVSPLTDHASAAMQVILHDITERKHLEEQVRQSKKMEAVGQLAGGVAHDFNNMLTIIAGHGDLLAEDSTLTDDQRRSIEQIRQACIRASSLTAQLLAFSRRQVMQPKVLNLNDVVANMEPMLRPLVGEHITLFTVLSPGLGHVRADPNQLEQVLINLTMNARDAMPDGGTLTIETGGCDLDEDVISRQRLDARPGRYVSLRVADTGVGMDEDTLTRIFEPFFTTKPKGKGTGLGLSTVYGIIKQSGGSIAVCSRPDQGASFTIYLPRVEEPVCADITGTESPDAFEGTETVLVAEDEPGVRSLVRDSLRLKGYTVLEAGNGTEALALAERHSGPIHLLLTDVIMPQMNGRELSERLKARRPGLKVLFMSGYTDDAVLRHGVVTEDLPFIQKPFTPSALAGKMRNVLDARDAKPASAIR
ncbi:MAG: ATP-binding protein [Nitrospirota bacterium]